MPAPRSVLFSQFKDATEASGPLRSCVPSFRGPVALRGRLRYNSCRCRNCTCKKWQSKESEFMVRTKSRKATGLAIGREEFLADRQGRTFADVSNDPEQVFDQVLDFFKDEERQRRMEESEI